MEDEYLNIYEIAVGHSDAFFTNSFCMSKKSYTKNDIQFYNTALRAHSIIEQWNYLTKAITNSK